jgi:hypothetical protein
VVQTAIKLTSLVGLLLTNASVTPLPRAPAEATLCADLASIPITPNVIYDLPGISALPGGFADVYDVFLSGGCTGCHNASAAGGLRLNQPAFVGVTLIGQPSTRYPDLLRVASGNPDDSLLYAILNCTPRAPYPTMPLGGAQIPLAQRALVYDWIAQGARAFSVDGNPIGDTIFRDAMESERFQRSLAPAFR